MARRLRSGAGLPDQVDVGVGITHVIGEVPDPGDVQRVLRHLADTTHGRADYRWSARWWQSSEAVIRLESLWRAWEHLRLDAAAGTSVWLRDHADHHLAVLMSPTGPWALSRDTASPDQPLPYQAPPEGLFPDVRRLS